MLKKTLTPKDFAKISSPYLDTGVKQDSWSILEVDILEDTLKAKLRMKSTFVSPTDQGGFHLTVFSASEFLSQLAVIYGHVWSGLSEKKGEVWMVESHFYCKKAIREPENINVEMKFPIMRKTKDKILMFTQSKVFDQNGLFTAELKYFFS